LNHVTPQPQGAWPPGAGGAAPERRRPGFWRRIGPGAAVTPFIVYSALGIGVPALGVIYYAFRGENGGWTTANVSAIVHGIYLVGFENSVKLALITSIAPGIFGVFVAYAIHTSRNQWLRRITATASGVLANFGGVNLTFMFIATLGSTGVLTLWLAAVHVNLQSLGFHLYTMSGVALVYLYFQIPLMVLVITPALVGLRPSWREAAENLGASSWRYWRHVGIPVLMPSVLGGMLLLFGSSFAAYATAQSLTTGIIALSPIQIGNFINGNVFSNSVNVGYAIALGMLVILSVVMILYSYVQKRASRWLR
jgi:putative spermidine/putrescine transport system permease protein